MRIAVTGCKHKAGWRGVPTPPDSSNRWFRCLRCGAYGFRKSQRHMAYKCGIKGCPDAATDRLPGRESRLGMKWRCARHMGEALTKHLPRVNGVAYSA